MKVLRPRHKRDIFFKDIEETRRNKQEIMTMSKRKKKKETRISLPHRSEIIPRLHSHVPKTRM